MCRVRANASLFRWKLQATLRCSVESCASLRCPGRLGRETFGVTALMVEPGERVDPSPLTAFEFGYVCGDGGEQRVPLVEVGPVAFEAAVPARRFRPRKGQRHLSGLWWSATTGAHVGYESWLERDHLLALDFDPRVVGIASQPFWLHWVDADGQRVSHVPDYFARRGDGSAVVVDCRPVERRKKPRDVAKFDATAGACRMLGWEYRLVGAVDPVETANLRWLAGYRHPRYRVLETEVALVAVFATAMPLMDGAELVGDPVAVLPVLFHLLWCHDLVADLRVPLSDATLVSGSAG